MTSRSANFRLLAWLLLIGGLLTSPFSLLILLMLIAPHYGDWPMTSFAWFAICAPPLSVITGIWMLLPQRGTSSVSPPLRPSAVVQTAGVAPSRGKRRKDSYVCLLVATALLCTAAATAYLVVNGLSEGTIPLPIKSSSLQRAVERQSEPLLFFFSLGLYGTISVGSLGAALWLMRHAFRPPRSRFVGPEGASH